MSASGYNFFANIESIPTPDVYQFDMSVNQVATLLAADQSFVTTVPADVTGWNFLNLQPLSKYWFQLNISALCDNTGGYALNCNGTIVPTNFRFCQQAFRNATTPPANNTTVFTNSIGGVGNISNLFAFGSFVTGASLGTFRIQAATNNGTVAFTIQTGSVAILTGPV